MTVQQVVGLHNVIKGIVHIKWKFTDQLLSFKEFFLLLNVKKSDS